VTCAKADAGKIFAAGRGKYQMTSVHWLRSRGWTGWLLRATYLGKGFWIKNSYLSIATEIANIERQDGFNFVHDHCGH
jgi:hypothetical protein